MNLDGEDGAKKYFLLWKMWVELSSKYPNGVTDKTSIAKIGDSSINPRKSTVAFVTELIDDGIIVFQKNGRLVFDEDKLDELLSKNSTYVHSIAFFKRNKITF